MPVCTERRRIVVSIVLLLIGVVPLVAEKQFFRRGPVEFQPLKDPNGRFVLEYPKKDWRVIPGGGSVLFTLAHKENEAAVVIEYERLDPPLAPEDITETFSNVIEVDEIKKRQPGASQFRPGIVTGPEGRQAQIDYLRTGLEGQERVRLISMPRGADLYRIICSAKVVHYAKYEAIFSHIVESFRTKPASTPGAGD